jgi:hypothetical protein
MPLLPSLRDSVPNFLSLPRTYVRGYPMPPLAGLGFGDSFCVFTLRVTARLKPRPFKVESFPNQRE